MSRAGTYWTESEISQAKQMALFGFSQYEIARKLGRSRSAVCHQLARKAPPESNKTCSDCGAKVWAGNTNGRCRSCCAKRNNADPAIRAKLIRAAQHYAKGNRETLRERARRAAATKRANPELMAALAENMRRNIQPKSCTPEAIARRDMVERGRAISRAKLPWCPEEYKQEYHWLCDAKGLRAADAKRIILDKIEAEQRKARASIANLSPFERQERALQKGAQIIANDRAPMFGEALKAVGE